GNPLAPTASPPTTTWRTPAERSAAEAVVIASSTSGATTPCSREGSGAVSRPLRAPAIERCGRASTRPVWHTPSPEQRQLHRLREVLAAVAVHEPVAGLQPPDPRVDPVAVSPAQVRALAVGVLVGLDQGGEL